MIRLIVNADDFGQTEGINEGIILAHREGIVTSTTLMANGTAFENAVSLAESHPALGVGIHLNLVEGRPVAAEAEVRSLLDAEGMLVSKFKLLRRHITGQLRIAEIRSEIDAQIERVLQAGLTPTHVDSHQHIHVYPAFFPIVAESARAHGIAAIRLPLERFRLRDVLGHPSGLCRTLAINAVSLVSKRYLQRFSLVTTDRFAGILRTGDVTAAWLRDWISGLRSGTVELMAHPGRCDERLRNTDTRLTGEREAELAALLAPTVTEAIYRSDIQLSHYGQLVDEPAEQISSGHLTNRLPSAISSVAPSRNSSERNPGYSNTGLD